MTAEGRYAFGAVLGTGGAGVVHEAWDRELQRTVAVKRVPLGETSDDWLREARIGANLGHPAFVVVHDAWRDEHHAHLVMERVDGRTFKEVIRQGPTDASVACGWIAQAAEALHSAHRQGIVHGDIKPSNLMVELGGRVRVLDVGIARLLDPLATMGTGQVGAGSGSGTLDYMAPEQLRGEPAGVASDIHALGLVLYELLHGRPTYGELAGMALAYRKVQGTAVVEPAAEGVPAWLGQLLESLLAQRPEQRPQDMAMVAAALRDIPTASPTSARDATTGTVPRLSDSAWRRHRWIALGVLAGATALAGLGIQFIGSTPESESPPAEWLADELATAEDLLKNYDDTAALDKAEARLRSLLLRAPKHAAAAALLAMVRCLQDTQGTTNQALRDDSEHWARQALREDGQLAMAHAAVGLSIALAGDWAAAESAFRQALVLEPTNWQALWWLAELLIKLQRYAEARLVLDQALASHPQERVFYDALGTLYHSQGDYTAAETAFRRSLALKPTGVVASVSLSDALTRLGRADEALAVLQQALRLRPHHRLYLHLGNALFDQDRFAEAAQAYERGLATLPKGQPDAWLQASRADALSRLPGREREARDSYRLALTGAETLARRYPANATFASRTGLYAARLGDTELAQRWIDKALVLAPDSPDALYRAAVVAALAGRRTQSGERLAQALARGQPPTTAAREPALAGISAAPERAASASTPTTTSTQEDSRDDKRQSH